MERSVEAQRQLIADAGHELRTPIASLRANIQVLGEAERLPAGEQENLRADIVSELDELTALVGDVVELARGAGRGDAEVEDVRLDEVVQGAVERTRRRGDLRFELDLEPTLVRGQGERIVRAVSNLLENAHKWSPAGGLVEIGLHDGVLSVRDHGPGFDELDLPFVFDRFYRADRARKLPGSGLGLAIVRQAAEACGGVRRGGERAGGRGAAAGRLRRRPLGSRRPGDDAGEWCSFAYVQLLGRSIHTSAQPASGDEVLYATMLCHIVRSAIWMTADAWLKQQAATEEHCRCSREPIDQASSRRPDSGRDSLISYLVDEPPAEGLGNSTVRTLDEDLYG